MNMMHKERSSNAALAQSKADKHQFMRKMASKTFYNATPNIQSQANFRGRNNSMVYTEGYRMTSKESANSRGKGNFNGANTQNMGQSNLKDLKD